MREKERARKRERGRGREREEEEEEEKEDKKEKDEGSTLPSHQQGVELLLHGEERGLDLRGRGSASRRHSSLARGLARLEELKNKNIL